MKLAGSMEQAKKLIEEAGFKFDELRSFAPEGGNHGMAFSVESERALWGHPKMEVRVVPANSSFAAERRLMAQGR